MGQFIRRRLLLLAVVVWGVATIAFVLLHLSGDPASLMLSPDAGPGAHEELRRALGLDAPLSVQYAKYMTGVLRGDFGNSIRQRLPAFDLVMERLPTTFELAAAGMVIAVVVGVPLGVIGAMKRGTVHETAALTVALFGQSVPSFWLALMMILVLGVALEWFPVSGRDGFHHLVLPAVAVSVESMARIARLLRSSILDQLEQDYTRTARSKGLTTLRVVGRHVLRNAAIPAVTLIGLDFGRLLGGAVIVETVFAWPGVGRLAVQAVFQRDFPVVQAAVVVLGFTFVIINLLVDLAYVWIDPRIRFVTRT